MKFNIKIPFSKNRKQPLSPSLPARGSDTDASLAASNGESQTSAAELVALLPAPRGFFSSRGLLVTCWTLMAPVISVVFAMGVFSGTWPIAVVALFLLFTSRRFNHLAMDREHAYGALRASHIGKEKIGALAETLEWPYPYARGVARLLLLRLLPTMKTEDRLLVSEDQRHFLYHRLTRTNAILDPELVTTIVNGIEHFNAAETKPYLNRMATMPGFTPGSRAVRRSAQEVLQRSAQQHETGLFSALTAKAQFTEEGIVSTLASLFDEEEHPPRETTEVPAAVHCVSARVDAQLQRFEEERRKYRPGMRIGFLLASWTIIVPFAAYQAFLAMATGRVGFCLIWIIATLCATQMYRFTLTSRHTQLARELADLDDIEGLGRLTEVLEWPDPEIQNIAAVALTRMLPRLKASDAGLLSPPQRTGLCRQLKMSSAASYPELLMAILKAFEQVGDAECVPYVRNLADTPPFTARQRKVRNAAAECLPYLMARAEQTHGNRVLLRASSSGTLQTTGLLRPASAAPDTNHVQLLRVAEENTP